MLGAVCWRDQKQKETWSQNWKILGSKSARKHQKAIWRISDLPTSNSLLVLNWRNIKFRGGSQESKKKLYKPSLFDRSAFIPRGWWRSKKARVDLLASIDIEGAVFLKLDKIVVCIIRCQSRYPLALTSAHYWFKFVASKILSLTANLMWIISRGLWLFRGNGCRSRPRCLLQTNEN